MITIDEAISHCEEVALDCDGQSDTLYSKGCYGAAEGYKDCANEHRQLAEWLKELKTYKGIEKTIREDIGFFYPCSGELYKCGFNDCKIEILNLIKKRFSEL
jgi:hypothetical protein